MSQNKTVFPCVGPEVDYNDSKNTLTMIFKRFISSLMMSLIVVAALAENNYKETSSSPLNIRERGSVPDTNVSGTFNNGSLIEVESTKKGRAKWSRWSKNIRAVAKKFDSKHSTSNKSHQKGPQIISSSSKTVSTKETQSVQSNNTQTPEISDFEKGPQMISSSSKTVSTKETQSVQSNNTQTPEISDFESERVEFVTDLSYAAGSFKEAKLSGTYGLSCTTLPWKIAPRLYAGIDFSPLNLNYGLNDYFNYAEIRLGPVIAYYFTPKIFISIPLNVLCQVYIGDDDKTKTGWGMGLVPAVYLGRKVGIFFGPQFTIGFSGNSKVSCGFRTGIYFGSKK